jgi:uncharacterized protein involved in type VI secretion and phage assembly
VNDTLLQDLMEHMRSRFFGKYRGVVTEVDADTMRIKASVPSVLGGIATGWASPCVPYAGPQVGFVMLPDKGSGVWIEFEGGDLSFPIWTGCYWNSGDIPDGASADVKSIVTKAGSLHFDNQASSVTAQVGSDHSMVIDDNGVTLRAGSGRSVAIGPSGVSVNDDAMEIS